MKDIVLELDTVSPFDSDRYVGWSLDQIIDTLRGSTLTLLKRGSIAVLIARREWGGLMVAASHIMPTQAEQTSWFRGLLDLDYSEVRRHMKLWVYWPRIAEMLRAREESCVRRGVPFVVPGYRRCLSLAGITGRDKSDGSPDQPPPPVEPEPLPTEVAALMQMVESLQQQNRLEREKQIKLTVELDLVREEIQDLLFNSHRSPPPLKPGGMIRDLASRLFGRRAKAIPPPPHCDHPADIEIRIGDCLDLIEDDDNLYDSIISDMPYAISLHGYDWDSTDISFSPALWQRLFRVLKPGGYVAVFAAARLYHRAAMACEAAGFSLHPFLGWRFKDGLPKPINLAELFDRDNLDEREVIGTRRGSGFTQANVDHGAQNRSHTQFTMHARHVSAEAQEWRGYYYGVNALKPCMEPILLAQKPISTARMIENVRLWGTGALNIGALHDDYGFWPSTLFTHRKAEKVDHQSDHPSVKPVALMEDLCRLVCPAGGRILDPFAGTGTTGVAAKNKGYDCVLIEQNHAMRAVIERRLAGG